MYGVRVNIDFVVRKNDGYGIIFKDGVMVRVRVKLALKPWYGIRKLYGNILKWRVRYGISDVKSTCFPFSALYQSVTSILLRIYILVYFSRLAAGVSLLYGNIPSKKIIVITF